MAIVGAIGSLASGVMGMMQANYQAQVANMNAKIAKENADRASTKSEIDAQETDLNTSILLGEQENAQAASGVTVSGKSQILTRSAARAAGNADRMKLIQGGQVERHGHLVQEANFKAEAQAAKLSGISSMVGGVFSAMGGMAGSMSSTAKATATPYKYIPQPIAKPTSLPMAPIIKPQNYGFINPLMKRSPYMYGAG